MSARSLALVLSVGGTPAPADTDYRAAVARRHATAYGGQSRKGIDLSESVNKDKPALRRARKNLTINVDGLTPVFV